MLQQDALHFARLDQLADPFEGSLSKVEYERWQLTAKVGEKQGSLPIGWHGKYFDVLMSNARRARQTMYVNCWYSGESDSEAMWRLYAAEDYAVAIQSRYQRLVQVLPEKIRNGCFIGRVQYVDHDEDEIPEGNSFTPVMHKRRAFEHEREVRAVIWYGDRGFQEEPDLSGNPLGLTVDVDLPALVERIFVSPTAPEWFVNTVRRVVADYELDVPVVQSGLARKPYL